MLARADLAIGHGLERRAERLAEFAEHLFRGVEGNAADQKDVLFHAGAPDCEATVAGSKAANVIAGLATSLLSPVLEPFPTCVEAHQRKRHAVTRGLDPRVHTVSRQSIFLRLPALRPLMD